VRQTVRNVTCRVRRGLRTAVLQTLSNQAILVCYTTVSCGTDGVYMCLYIDIDRILIRVKFMLQLFTQ